MPALQTRLLDAAFGMLARGGRLVYVTCTLTRRENGELIRQLTPSYSPSPMPPRSAPSHCSGARNAGAPITV